MGTSVQLVLLIQLQHMSCTTWLIQSELKRWWFYAEVFSTPEFFPFLSCSFLFTYLDIFQSISLMLNYILVAYQNTGQRPFLEHSFLGVKVTGITKHVLGNVQIVRSRKRFGKPQKTRWDKSRVLGVRGWGEHRVAGHAWCSVSLLTPSLRDRQLVSSARAHCSEPLPPCTWPSWRPLLWLPSIAVPSNLQPSLTTHLPFWASKPLQLLGPLAAVSLGWVSVTCNQESLI